MEPYTHLSKAQRAAIPAYVKKWIARGLCTAPADRATAERALRALYGYADLSTPTILWVPNPEALAATLVGRDTGSAVESTVESAVVSAVESAVESAVRSAVRAAVRSAYDGGQTWVAGVAYMQFFHEIAGLELPGDLDARAQALADYRSSVGPVGLWFAKVAILCERPLSFEPLVWRAEA